MTKDEVMKQLEALTDAQTKKTLLRHGAKEPFFGVKIGDMKPIQKKIKKDYQLSKELFATGIGDAQYLAGLIADETKMTKKDLEDWISTAAWSMISDFTVPWIAAESKYGWELGLKWIESKKDNVAAAGWATLSSVVSLMPDDKLDLKHLSKLLNHIGKEIHRSANKTTYSMNSFVIAVGCYVTPLNSEAKAIAKKMGKVTVDLGDTACVVPDAATYIDKVDKAGKLGRKKKMARC